MVIARYLISVTSIICSLALCWGGYGQASPDSYYLYGAALLLGLCGFTLLIKSDLARVSWGLAVISSAAHALYRIAPLLSAEYGPIRLFEWPILIIFALAPLVISSLVFKALPRLTD